MTKSPLGKLRLPLALLVTLCSILTIPADASFILHPKSRSVPLGMRAEFTAADQNLGLSYQWQLNGTNVPGATGTNYIISAVLPAHVGDYHLISYRTVGSVTSQVARLELGPVGGWGTEPTATASYLPPPGLSNIVAVAAGPFNVNALQSDGRVLSWSGGNSFAQISSLSNVVAISRGRQDLLALRNDGQVYVNSSLVPGLSNVVAVAADTNCVALRADGSVVMIKVSPLGWTVRSNLNRVTAIDSGGLRTIAVRHDGSVALWKSNLTVPVPPSLPANVIDVATAPRHSLALTADGTVVAWGEGGLLLPVPASISNAITIKAVSSAGTNVSLALLRDGRLLGWGANITLANAPAAATNVAAFSAQTNYCVFVRTDGPPLIVRPPVGGTFHSGADLVLRTKPAGTPPLNLQWWKDGAPLENATNEVLTIPGADATHAGNYRVTASNEWGTAESIIAPVSILDSRPIFVAPLANQTFYLGSPARLCASVVGSGPMQYQWFRNGIPIPGETRDELVIPCVAPEHAGAYRLSVTNSFGGSLSPPVQATVSHIAWAGYMGTNFSNAIPEFTNCVAVSVGYGWGMGLRSNGTVFAWGFGSGTNLPAGLSGIKAIAAGNHHFGLALRSNGTVAAWGSFGSATNVPAAAMNVVAIAAGESSALALRSDGSVVTWGPAFSNGLSHVVGIAAGYSDNMALRSDGRLQRFADGLIHNLPLGSNNVSMAMGNGYASILRADGTVVEWIQGSPVNIQPTQETNFVMIGGAARGTWVRHHSALRYDGSVAMWGDNQYESFDFPSEITSATAVSSSDVTTVILLNDRSPRVTVHPWDRRVAAGTNVLLTAMAAGRPPLQYQWYFNNSPIPGATNGNLVITNASRAARGLYFATVSNELGQDTTRSARLEVGGALILSHASMDEASGAFSLRGRDSYGGGLSGEDLSFFGLEVSTNLIDWITISGHLSVTNGFLRIEDPESTNAPNRFYRVVERW